MDITSPRHRMALLAAVSASLLSSAAFAQTGPDLLLGSFGDGQNVVGQAEAIFLESGHTQGTDNDAQLYVYNASGRFKLDFDGVIPGINRAQPRAGFQATYLDLHTDDPSLPNQLTDVSFGIGLGIAKGEKWVVGASIALGYASATPFGDGNGWYGKADVAVGYTLNAKEKIGVVLDYNGNRTFLPDWPLPGIIYTRVLNDQITVEVGFPFSDITYKPDDKWTFLLRYLIPDGGQANVDYAVTPSFHVYGGLEQQNEAFHWDELGNSHDRVIFNQTRAEVGVRGAYRENFSFFVAAGYAFNTQFDFGYDSNDTDNLADLSDEPYARVGIELKF